jgi:N-(2-amino-2-carboxyethyl)-L-glutamate synthase
MDGGVLTAIGNTPLVRLTRVLGNLNFSLFAKLESANPGGSIKDRAAVNIIKKALENGEIGLRTTVIESSSGNMGIGLAMACAYLGLRFICVVDTRATVQNINILRAYGAEVDMVSEPDPVTGDLLQARIDRVKVLMRLTDDSFWPNQYANENNSFAHYHTTMREVATAMAGQLDYLFCATSTCGTIRGCAEYIVENDLKTKVIAVDTVGSVIFGGERKKRLIPGLGAAIVPPLCRRELVDECVYVTDADCIVGCRRLVMREGILAGGSSGGLIMAVERLKDRIPTGARCVLICPDRGERYIDTIYSDKWVKENFGNIEYQWQNVPDAHG